ncbi:MAG: hypothetical protein WBA46_14325 [Thermomicrobiales bacterium]
MSDGDKAWCVGDGESGYSIVKATTRTKARQRAPQADGDFETWSHLSATRRPEYDHLSEDDAYRQWCKDMEAKYGPSWDEA